METIGMQQKRGTEEVGRDVRYQFFDEIFIYS